MKKPSMVNPLSFRNQVLERQAKLGLTDAEVAKAIGFSTAKLYSATMQQKFPMPLGTVPHLAKTLGVDPGQLLRAAMSEIVPDFLAMIDEYLRPSELNEREAQLVQQFRKVTGGRGLGPVVFYDCVERRTLVLEVEGK